MLVIVVNNGIVLVDYTNMLRNYSLRDAVMEPVARLRPVLMTSFTTILGMRLRRSVQEWEKRCTPRCVTIIGGLFVSVLTTLILVPTMYTALYHRTLIEDRISVRLAKGRGKTEENRTN